jgi:hypothetical protein
MLPEMCEKYELDALILKKIENLIKIVAYISEFRESFEEIQKYDRCSA